jgi:hypothetical protein
MEVRNVEFEFRDRFDIDYFARLTPKGLNKLFIARRHALEDETYKIQMLMLQITHRPFLKAWLKAQGQMRRDAFRLQDELSEWMDDFR